MSNPQVATRMIEARSAIKIKELPLASEDANDVVSLITAMRIMVGQNKDVSEKQLAVEAKFLHTTYGDVSVNEIDLMFELFMSNRLDVDLPQYVSFSPLFISHLINSYKRYKKSTMSHVYDAAEKDLIALQEKSESTIEKRVQGLKDCIAICHSHYEQGWSSRFFVGTTWDFIKKRAHRFTKEEIANAGKYAENRWAEDRKNEKFKKGSSERVINVIIELPPAIIKPLDEALELYCREYLIGVFFQKTPLIELINSITEKDLYVRS